MPRKTGKEKAPLPTAAEAKDHKAKAREALQNFSVTMRVAAPSASPWLKVTSQKTGLFVFVPLPIRLIHQIPDFSFSRRKLSVWISFPLVMTATVTARQWPPPRLIGFRPTESDERSAGRSEPLTTLKPEASGCCAGSPTPSTAAQRRASALVLFLPLTPASSLSDL